MARHADLPSIVVFIFAHIILFGYHLSCIGRLIVVLTWLKMLVLVLVLVLALPIMSYIPTVNYLAYTFWGLPVGPAAYRQTRNAAARRW